MSTEEQAREAIGKAIHGYACGCQNPWPTNPNYDAMERAVLAAVVPVIAEAMREYDPDEESQTARAAFHGYEDFDVEQAAGWLERTLGAVSMYGRD